MFIWVRYGEGNTSRCFNADVTCDNLLDAVRHTVEEETTVAIRRREAEFLAQVQEATFEEQTISNRISRFEALQEPVPPDLSAQIDGVRARQYKFQESLKCLQASCAKFKGLSSCDIDLAETSGTLKKLSENPRRRAAELLHTRGTYLATRLDKDPETGAVTQVPLIYSLGYKAPSPQDTEG
ncbi:unnamed protein product [Discosporangium mesarthrocarpum]